MSFSYAKDLLSLGYKVKMRNWSNSYIINTESGYRLISKTEKSRYIPSICDMESTEWTIMYK